MCIHIMMRYVLNYDTNNSMYCSIVKYNAA